MFINGHRNTYEKLFLKKEASKIREKRTSLSDLHQLASLLIKWCPIRNTKDGFRSFCIKIWTYDSSMTYLLKASYGYLGIGVEKGGMTPAPWTLLGCGGRRLTLVSQSFVKYTPSRNISRSSDARRRRLHSPACPDAVQVTLRLGRSIWVSESVSH